MKASIGIIGNGFVGSAVANGFSDVANVNIYDIDPDKTVSTYNNAIFSEYVFVCLPTPMTKVEGGCCNLSILEGFFENVPSVADGIFVIKSTVPIGTTERLSEIYPYLKIVHNPEFLTALNAEDDFVNSDRTVIGGNKDYVGAVSSLYKMRFPDTPIYTMKSSESEAVKYFANCFLASKVMVFNEMKVLCDNINNVDYDTVMSGVISDNRIGKSHYDVPGPDGDYGFGGTCFPKDINALISIMEENGMNPIVLKSIWEQNKNYRNNWDWSDNKSAVLENGVIK
jgi:nucleotide sugar dehydrogenase